MEVGELVKQTAKKKQMQKKRDQMIRYELKKKQRERVNLDQSSIKKGHIQKQKFIQKKKYQTIFQKTKKIPVELQQNVNPNTFLSKTHHFNKVLQRTKQRVLLQQDQLRNGITAINAYGIAHKEIVMNFTLHFQKEIKCQPRPFLIKLPEPQPCQMVIIVLPSVKQKQEGAYAFQKIKQLNLKAWSNSAFIEKMNNDKIFSLKVFQQQIKILVKFELMKNNKFYEGLLKKGIPVFPIDSKKVPSILSHQIEDYPDYIQYLISHYVAISKTGQDQIFRLKVGNVDSIVNNTQTIVHEFTAKLLQRSKQKMNKLMRVSLKTPTSINFDLYNL